MRIMFLVVLTMLLGCSFDTACAQERSPLEMDLNELAEGYNELLEENRELVTENVNLNLKLQVLQELVGGLNDNMGCQEDGSFLGPNNLCDDRFFISRGGMGMGESSGGP